MPHLAEIVTEFRQHFETAKTDAEKFLSEHLPALAGLAERAAGNPLVDAALNAVHLSPSMLQALADVITKAEADLAALQPAPASTGPDPDGQPADAVPA